VILKVTSVAVFLFFEHRVYSIYLHNPTQHTNNNNTTYNRMIRLQTHHKLSTPRTHNFYFVDNLNI